MRVIFFLISCSMLFLVITSGEEEIKQREFEFIYKATIDGISKDAKEVDIWIPYPTGKLYQKITDISVQCPFVTKINYDKAFGNAVLYVKVLAPKEQSFEIEVKYKVVRKERKDIFIKLKDSENYLKENNLIIIDETIKKLASDITRDKKTELEKAKAVYGYVLEHMEYDKSGTGWGRGDTKYACEVGKGNCTDFHSLFISLMRAAHIPAKFIMGFLLPTDKKNGEIGGYHCWAEFYIEGKGWIPVDISEAKKQKRENYFFGACCENRIELSEGRDIILEPKQAGEPLNYFIYPYSEIDGKMFENMKTNFTFYDLQRGR